MLRVPFSRTITSFVEERIFLKEIANSGWQFSPHRLHMIANERKEWLQYYLPSFSLEGKTVLDIGAGEGETAKVFLEAGAKRVICVECDPVRFPYLLANAKRYPLTLLCRPFQVADLFRFGVDFIKVDIEGYEEAVLKYRLPAPAVFEVHGLQLRDKFAAAGYSMALPAGGAWWTCYGYWDCKPKIQGLYGC